MRSRRHRSKRVDPQGDLLLAAMVDILVNVLLFLLTLYGASPTELGAGMELPTAASKDESEGEIELTITQDLVAVGGTQILALDQNGGWSQLPPEAQERGLQKVRSRLEAHRASAGQETAVLAVAIDRRTPWSVVAPIIQAAGDAGFSDLHFVVTSVGKP